MIDLARQVAIFGQGQGATVKLITPKLNHHLLSQWFLRGRSADASVAMANEVKKVCTTLHRVLIQIRDEIHPLAKYTQEIAVSMRIS